MFSVESVKLCKADCTPLTICHVNKLWKMSRIKVESIESLKEEEEEEEASLELSAS